MNRKLGKNILIVLVANIINIFFQVLTSFLLPKHLSVDCYAGIKTYTLYLSYVGLFHFGFIDGMYIKYGGEEWNTINRKDLLVNLRTLRNFEFFVSIICITASLIVKNSILLCFSLSLVPLNMSSYFKQLYQATGEFQYYGKIMNYSTGGIFICNMILLFIIRVDNEMAYILGNVFIYTMIWILLECRFLKKVKIKTGIFFSMKELLYNIKTGILLTLGNLSTTILTSMDRWFVKELLNVVAFAQYSFAVSMENFMNVAVTPIAVTLYNFFCKNTKKEEIRQVKNVVMIFAALLVSSAFPANLVLSTYLTEYIESAKVLFLLFSSQIFNIIIKSVYVNLYKSQKRQRRYFCKLCVVMVAGFILNIVCFWIKPTKESFASATLLSAMLWYLLCLGDFKQLQENKKELFYPFVQAAVFLFCGFKCSAMLGLSIYLCETIVSTVIVFPQEVGIIVEACKNTIKAIGIK